MKFWLSFSLAIGLLGTARAQTPPPLPQDNPPMVAPDGIVIETWTIYFDEVDRTAMTVNFNKGSSALAPGEKERLENWVSDAAQKNPKLKMVVASWSDKLYPVRGTPELTKDDRNLADDRNDMVKGILKKAGASVETYSMAVRPNWFQRAFSTDAAQIKGEAKNHGWDNKNEDRIASILEKHGGPSKAVIILRPVSGDTMTTGR